MDSLLGDYFFRDQKLNPEPNLKVPDQGKFPFLWQWVPSFGKLRVVECLSLSSLPKGEAWGPLVFLDQPLPRRTEKL